MEIISKNGTKTIFFPWVLRPLQIEILRNIGRFGVVVAHRRFGKTLMFLLHMVLCSFHTKHKNPKYAYICPVKDQAKRNAWGYIKDFAQYLPNAETKENELLLLFDLNDGMGKRSIQLLGADEKGAALKGQYFDGVVLDEMEEMPPEVWSDVVRPMLSDRKGWGYLTGTAGQGSFYDFWRTHEEDPNSEFKLFNYKITDTNILDAAEQESTRKGMSKDGWEKYYMNNWFATSPGAYYGDSVIALEKEGKISDQIVPLMQRPVICSWDLGATDLTSVWFFQLHDDMSYRFIDYLEMNRDSIRYMDNPESFDVVVYKEVIKRGYHIGAHILPWDSKHKHISAQYSTHEKFKQMSGQAKIIVADKIPIDIGIATTQSMVAQACFHKSKCSRGLSALSVYSDTSPKWASHAPDSLRYAAVAARHLVGDLRNKLQNIKKVNKEVQTVCTFDPL